MPKFVVNGEGKFDPETEFYLEQHSRYNTIHLMARNAGVDGGREWFILEIKKDGTIGRHGSVNADLGFKLNARGRVRLDDE